MTSFVSSVLSCRFRVCLSFSCLCVCFLCALFWPGGNTHLLYEELTPLTNLPLVYCISLSVFFPLSFSTLLSIPIYTSPLYFIFLTLDAALVVVHYSNFDQDCKTSCCSFSEKLWNFLMVCLDMSWWIMKYVCLSFLIIIFSTQEAESLPCWLSDLSILDILLRCLEQLLAIINRYINHCFLVRTGNRKNQGQDNTPIINNAIENSNTDTKIRHIF